MVHVKSRCGQLKLESTDGKTYKTDWAKEQMGQVLRMKIQMLFLKT